MPAFHGGFDLRRALPVAEIPTTGSPLLPPHFILFLSSSASDCLSLEGWQHYINLPDLRERRGLPTWLSKDLFCVCWLLETLTKSSSRKASASWWHFLASQLTFMLVNTRWALPQKLVLTLVTRSFFTFDNGHSAQFRGPTSILSPSRRSRQTFSALHFFWT